MWRSLISAERLEGLNLEERGNYWFGPGRTLITYWVRPKKLYSILASVPADEVQRESWDDSGDISEMLRSFDDAEPRARKMLEQCPSRLHHRGMFYRDPSTSWTAAASPLLGDAAHPMVPFLAAGAGQSIEDAWTFARVVARRQDDVPGALLEYQAPPCRAPRASRPAPRCREADALRPEQRVRDRNGRWKGMARIDPLAETSGALRGPMTSSRRSRDRPAKCSTSRACAKASGCNGPRASAPSISGNLRSGPKTSRVVTTGCATLTTASSPRTSRFRMASTPSRTNSVTSRRGACRRRMRRAAMSCCISTAAAI
jgi:hypothetical protein